MSLVIARWSRISLATAILLMVLASCAEPALAGRAESDALLKQGQAAIQNKDFIGAVVPLQNAIKADPSYDLPYATLADLWNEMYKYDDAAALMEKTTQLKPGNAVYWLKLGRYRFSAKKTDAAVAALKQAIKVNPKLAEAHYWLGRVYTEKKSLADAETELKAAVDADASNLNYKLWLSRVQMDEGKEDAAYAGFKEITDKLATTKGDVYTQASDELQKIQSKRQGATLRKVLMIGIPVVLLVVGGFVAMSMMRGKRGGGGARMDLPADAATYEEIAATALRRLVTMTQMSHGLMYVASLDGDELQPRATVVIDTDNLTPLAVDVNELPRWIERNDGKSFLFNVEKKEGVFIKAFPEAREAMEPMDIRIGVPFIFQEKLLGMAFLGAEKTKDILKLKKLYERSQMDLYRLAVEVAAALHRIYENDLTYIDLATKFKSRKYVEENLPRELVSSDDSNRKGVVLMFEFDQYRQLEEQYGDNQADSVLKMIAAEVKILFPPDEGILARFEAGRFFGYIPIHTIDQAKAFAEKLHSRIGATRISRNLPQPTASVGGAIYPDHGRKADDLIWSAERIMLGISAAGGNGMGLADASAQSGSGPRVVDAPVGPAAGAAMAASPTVPSAPAGEAAPRIPGFSGGGGAPVPPRPLRPSAPERAPEAPAAGGSAPPWIPGFSGGGAAKGPLRPGAAPPAAEPAAAPAGSVDDGSAPERRVVAPGRVPSWMKTSTDAGEGKPAAPAGPPPMPRIGAPPPAPAPADTADTAGGAPRIPGFSGTSGARPFPGAPATPPPAPSADAEAATAGPPRIPGFSGAGATRPMPPGFSGAPTTPPATPGGPVAPPTIPGFSGGGASRPPTVPGFGGGPASRPPAVPGFGGGPASRPPAVPGFGGGPTAMPPTAPSSPAPGTPPAPAHPRPAVPGFGGESAAPEPPEAPASGDAKGAPPWARNTTVAPEAGPSETQEMPPQAPRQQGRGLLSRAGGGAPKSPFRRSSGDDAGEAPARPAPIASTRAGVEAPAIDLGPSARDPETGFVLSDRLEEVVARCVDHAYEAQEPCSVLYFRLDRHDAIVGQVGEQRMAELVREVTSLVNDFLKEGTDIPGRWGDDGFAILLPRTSSRIACNLAEQIRFTIGNLTFPGLSEKTTLSLGIAAYPEQAHSPQELLRYAREAAMETQQQGGDAIRVYAGG